MIDKNEITHAPIPPRLLTKITRHQKTPAFLQCWELLIARFKIQNTTQHQLFVQKASDICHVPCQFIPETQYVWANG